MNKSYNPDVLSCLANLSSDEVFTSPQLANQILDQLPKNLWQDKEVRFLDPCCKSGVFLREITKRLLIGLENQIPDLQKRKQWVRKAGTYILRLQEEHDAATDACKKRLEELMGAEPLLSEEYEAVKKASADTGK